MQTLQLEVAGLRAALHGREEAAAAAEALIHGLRAEVGQAQGALLTAAAAQATAEAENESLQHALDALREAEARWQQRRDSDAGRIARLEAGGAALAMHNARAARAALEHDAAVGRDGVDHEERLQRQRLRTGLAQGECDTLQRAVNDAAKAHAGLQAELDAQGQAHAVLWASHVELGERLELERGERERERAAFGEQLQALECTRDAAEREVTATKAALEEQQKERTRLEGEVRAGLQVQQELEASKAVLKGELAASIAAVRAAAVQEAAGAWERLYADCDAGAQALEGEEEARYQGLVAGAAAATAQLEVERLQAVLKRRESDFVRDKARLRKEVDVLEVNGQRALERERVLVQGERDLLREALRCVVPPSAWGLTEGAGHGRYEGGCGRLQRSTPPPPQSPARTPTLSSTNELRDSAVQVRGHP